MKLRFILQRRWLCSRRAAMGSRTRGLAVLCVSGRSYSDHKRERNVRVRDRTRQPRIILLRLVMDVIYQVIVLGTFHLVEALIIALLPAFVPYLLIRGPATRVVRRWRGRASGSEIR
jgi:hypothetical protein